MFAFGISRTLSHAVVFAAEPSTLGWILIVAGIILFSRLFRRSRRMGASGTHPRRRIFWKLAVLGIVAFVAVRHFSGPQCKWTGFPRLSDNDQFRAIEARWRSGPFPPIKEKDLWALRRAKSDTARAPDDDAVDAALEGRPNPPAEPLRPQPVPRRGPTPRPPDHGPRVSRHIAPDVARTIAEVQALAWRAGAEAKGIMTRSSRDVAALTVFGARKDVPIDADEQTAPDEPEPSAATTSAAQTVPAAADPAPPSDTVATLIAASAPTSAATPAVAAAPEPKAVSGLASAQVASPHDQKSPEWLNAAPGRDGDTYYTSVTVGPWKSVEECEKELPPKLHEAVTAYVENYLGAGASKSFDVPLPFIHDYIVRERYVQETESETAAVGTVVNLHVRLAFDSRTRAQLKRMYREAQVESRLLDVAGGAGIVLLLLGTVFGYLKLDTLTRGYYTHRLQFAAAGLILATAGVVAWRYGVPPVRGHRYVAPSPAVVPSKVVPPAEVRINLTDSPAG